MNNIEESSEKKENKYLSFIKKNKTILLSITITGLLVIAGYFSIKSIIFENKYKEAEVNFVGYTAKYMGKAINVNAKEFEILKMFLKNRICKSLNLV